MTFTTIAAIGMRAIETWFRKQCRLPARPYKWLLELTFECNSRCRSCSIWRTPAAIKRTQLTLAEMESLFAANGSDLAWLTLSGGEVTCYDDFAAVIALAKRYCKALRLVTFTTNGLLPQKALAHAQAVRAAGFDSFVTISLDGDAETHDRIRGVRGNHDLAWRTFNLLHSAGINVHFGITLSESNVDFVERHYVALRNEIKAVTILHEQGIYAQTNAIEDSAAARSLGIIDSAYCVVSVGELIEKCYLRLARKFVLNGRSSNVIQCAVGRAALHIRADGTTLLCMFMPELGNVRWGEKLRDMVNSKHGAESLRQIDAGHCPHCWMNCYAPHSILLNPMSAVVRSLVIWSSLQPILRQPLTSSAYGVRRAMLQRGLPMLRDVRGHR